jgi:VWFA-related protein
MPALRSFVLAGFLFSVVAGVSTLRVTSNLVFLDVNVIDRKGRPVVTGLTKDDFAITENGKPQRIFSFDAPATGAKTAEGAPATILVLDLMNTTSADSAYARDSIRRYLALQPKRLQSPTELMVLNNTTLDLVQAYTHSRGDLVVALNHVPPALPYKLGSQQFGSRGWLGQRLSQSIEALQQIALQNKGLPGRKNILWVGYGGPGMGIDPGDPRYDKELRFYAHGTTNMLVDARISLFLIRPGLRGAGNPDVFRLESESVQTGANPYGVDPFAKIIDFGLFIHGTGGRLFSQRNDDDIAMTEAQELGSNYYTLTYQPKTGEDNGEFRKIKVVLRDPNLRAVTKTGYYAPEPTMNTDSTPYRVDPIYEIEEAAQSEVPFDSLGMSLVQVARHPDSETVELTTLLKSTHLRWQATDDGRSTADITIAAVSLSKHRDILASRLRRLTIFSNSQDPARLSASNTLVTITVTMPRRTESVRAVILAQDGGQVGALEVGHKELARAPDRPTPQPQLRQRPEVTSQQRP